MGIESGSGGGFDDEGLKSGRTTTSQWEINSSNLHKITKARVYEVAFKGATKWIGPDE